MTRVTAHLRCTYEAVATAADHPTAREVFSRVRESLPTVSLGTIYRNLDKLCRQGELRILRLESGAAHYDAMLAPHDHFVCESCGRLTDVAARGAEAFTDLEAMGCRVRRASMVMYGTCGECCSPDTEHESS